jgi:hypothetical protein
MAYDETRNFLGGISTDDLSDEVLYVYIKDARQRVIDDGVASDHAQYKVLVRYAVGLLLTKAPASGSLSGVGGSGGGIKKEKVGDVEIEYKGDSGSTGGTVIRDMPGGGYEHEYLRILRNIIGMTHVLV